jgi:hypothetical protein
VRYLRLWLVVVGLAGLIVGFLVGARVRLWPWRADWFEATGVWVSAALSAAILVWLALRSEKLAQAQAEEQARHEADLIECAAVVAQGDKV